MRTAYISLIDRVIVYIDNLCYKIFVYILYKPLPFKQNDFIVYKNEIFEVNYTACIEPAVRLTFEHSSGITLYCTSLNTKRNLQFTDYETDNFKHFKKLNTKQLKELKDSLTI